MPLNLILKKFKPSRYTGLTNRRNNSILSRNENHGCVWFVRENSMLLKPFSCKQFYANKVGGACLENKNWWKTVLLLKLCSLFTSNALFFIFLANPIPPAAFTHNHRTLRFLKQTKKWAKTIPGFFYFAPILNAKFDLPPVFIIVRFRPLHVVETQRTMWKGVGGQCLIFNVILCLNLPFLCNFWIPSHAGVKI